MTRHLRNDIPLTPPPLTCRGSATPRPSEGHYLRAGQSCFSTRSDLNLVLSSRLLIDERPSSGTTALACGTTRRATNCPPRQLCAFKAQLEEPQPLPLEAGVPPDSSPSQSARGLNLSACRGREGPFKVRTMAQSSCRSEKPAAGHSTPCHTCSPDRKRACSLGQPLHTRTFPVQSLDPHHQLLQWAQPDGRNGRKEAPWMPSPLVSGH